MDRTIGTTARGIRTPIIREGDDIIKIVVDSVLEAAKAESFELKDRDIIGITESLIARAQGNYATTKDISVDISNKFSKDIGIVFPILSRNRFAILLKGIIESKRNLHILLSYPADEFGNHIMDINKMLDLNINPYSDILTEEEYRKFFGESVLHPFTGIDYVDMYKKMGNGKINIYFSNDPRTILRYTKDVLVSNVHDRLETKKLLEKAGANKVFTLGDILTEPINGSGFNPEYGLLGSNLASKDEVKLFPRDSQMYVEKIQKVFMEKLGKKIEVMIYGDGAFKDPVGKIWEFADPLSSPGFTDGLLGTPNEIKLKYIVDTELGDLNEEQTMEAVKRKITDISYKDINLLGEDASMGTTPRQIIDLLATLCDLVSGSGDKGTPVVLVQGYFDNYASK